MAKQTINLGSGPNASDGTPLRDAFEMVNDNFDELYSSKTALESGKEPTITGGSTAQYWRGDKTFQTLNKAAVGLPNVDNTSDANKPVSTATQTALDAKVDEGSITTSNLTMTTARVLGRSTSGSGAIEELTAAATKTMLALDNVNNTTDADKPVSAATQTALDGKANTSHTHVPADVTMASQRILGRNTAATGGAEELTSTQVKSIIGLSNVNNTADADKPISTATQTALNGKAATVHTHEISDVNGLQSALDGKMNTGGTFGVSDITGLEDTLATKLEATDLSAGLATKADVDHTHVAADITDLLDVAAPIVHTHEIDDVSGLQSALDGKSNTGHTHTIANVTGLQAELVHSVKDFLGTIVANSRLADVSDSDFTVVIANSKVVAGVAATAETVFNINKNNVSIGTVTFEASGTVGTIDIPVVADRDFTVGDVVELVGPSSADATLARVAMVFRN